MSSADVSIRNAVRQIQRSNKRQKSRGHYLTSEELMETLADAYKSALDEAALEAFEGRYEAEEIATMIDRTQILNQAIALILDDTP